MIILDPSGRENTIPIKIRKEPNGVFVCDYTPAVQGVHSVNVFFANQPIAHSPFAVGVSNGNVIIEFSTIIFQIIKLYYFQKMFYAYSVRS